MIWSIHIPKNSIEKIDVVSLKISKEFDKRIRSALGASRKYIDHYELGIIWSKHVGDDIIVSFVDQKSRDELYDMFIQHREV